jgi:hypothetical protein
LAWAALMPSAVPKTVAKPVMKVMLNMSVSASM